MSTVEMAAATRRQRAAALSRAALGTKSAEPADAALSRRGFFSWLAVAWVAFTAAAAAGGAAMTRFLFPNVLFEPPQVFKAGLPEDYDVGKVDERWKEKFGAWVVRNEQGIYALSTTCTHLGCTPNWLEGENKFKCPCHGSGFYRTGINFEGPAPRPLERYRIVLADDGQILVDKTVKYQQEKGQWDDPESFLKLA
jgi:cytochrome b6-f complex iron-sulfur subunit